MQRGGRRGRGRLAIGTGMTLLALAGCGATASGALATGHRATAVAAVASPGPNGTPTLPITGQPGPGVTNGPVPAVPTGGSTLRASEVIQLPSAAKCVTQVRIGFAHPRSVHLRSMRAHIGRRLIVRRPVPSSLTLHLLPQGRFKLKVSVSMTTRLVRTRSRTYTSCA
jgi:hypothetical protein